LAASHHSRQYGEMNYRAPRILFILLFPLSCLGSTLHQIQLRSFCASKKGELRNEWRCPQTPERIRQGQFCFFKDEKDQLLVTNGCTGASKTGEYGALFINACIEHDLCYHHEPIESGLDKIDCDQQFYSRLKTVCRKVDSKRCLAVAKAFYEAVENKGESSWRCSKEPGQYKGIITHD
jgi:hypothetical protein